MARQFNLVVVFAVALLAAVTQTDARRFPARSSSVSVTLVGPGSYSSSQSTSFPSSGSGSPSKFLTQVFNNERATIMRESRESQSSRPGDRFVRSKLPTANQFPAPSPSRFGWPSSSRPSSMTRGGAFSGFGGRTSTTGSSSFVTSGNSQVSVGGSGSASASGSSSFFSSFG